MLWLTIRDRCANKFKGQYQTRCVTSMWDSVTESRTVQFGGGHCIDGAVSPHKIQAKPPGPQNVAVFGKVKVWVTQSCPTLCDPMDCSPPSSSVHGVLQARVLGWGALPFSGGSSQPKDQTQVPCIAGRVFTAWATTEALFWRTCLPGSEAFKGVLKINEVLWGCPNLMGLVSRRRGCGDTGPRGEGLWGHGGRWPSPSQGEKPRRKPVLQTAWPWSSSLQNCEKHFAAVSVT